MRRRGRPGTTAVKVLTLTQPWATLVVVGAKNANGGFSGPKGQPVGYTRRTRKVAMPSKRAKRPTAPLPGKCASRGRPAGRARRSRHTANPTKEMSSVSMNQSGPAPTRGPLLGRRCSRRHRGAYEHHLQLAYVWPDSGPATHKKSAPWKIPLTDQQISELQAHVRRARRSKKEAS